MNLNYLQTLVAVKQYGNFSAAARQIGLTQPAVSLQIQSLEEELGAQLVVRNARTCELTPAGEALVEFAEEAFQRLQQTRSLVSQLTGEISGPVRIGASTIPGSYILPRMLAGFVRQYPKVRVQLQIGDSEQILDWLDNKLIDFGVIGSMPPATRAEASYLASDQLLLTVPAGHPWAGQTIGADQLREQPFVARESGSGTRDTYERELGKLGVDTASLQTVLVGGSSNTVLTAVEAGIGYSFCSQWALSDALALGRVATAQIQGLEIRRSFYLVAHPDRFRTPAADRLLRDLRQQGQEHRRGGERE
ncbi:MAG: selenium metabolism-associated LysR family transcriptional regulator [Bacillota bacterium]|jgi:DNA-binding transcriptional LysR family regulator